MFRAFLNGECFYDDRVDSKSIQKTKLVLEENKAGSFEFTIYPDNPYYSAFEKMKSIITIKQNDEIIFRGRVLDSEESFYKDRTIVCEGELAFFNDSVVYPFGYADDEGSTEYTPIEILEKIMDYHNAQVTPERSFILGHIDVAGTSDKMKFAQMEYAKSLEIMEDLLKRFGGHFMTRYADDGGVFLDWLTSYEPISQNVEFGINLLDMVQKIQGADIITGILPTGDTNEDTGYPSDITKMTLAPSDLYIHMGAYIVNKELYEKYGAIIEQRSYDGYPADWINEVLKEVSSLSGLTKSIEISAIDMAWLNDVDFFSIGKSVKVISPNHDIDGEYNLIKVDIDLQNPDSNKFTFGKIITNFIEQVIIGDKTKPMDGESVKIKSYSYDHANSEDGVNHPDDSEFLPDVQPIEGMYYWTRVTTHYSDGTDMVIYYPSYQGETAKLFAIQCNKSSVIRNDRLSGNQEITFTANINGYPNAVPRWYMNGSHIKDGASLLVSTPYKGASDITITLMDKDTVMDRFTLPVIDKTGGSIYLGIYDKAVPTETPSGSALIKGDYFFCTKNFDVYKNGDAYVFDGTTFVDVIRGENVTDDEWAKIMNGCLDDATFENQEEDTQFFKFFKRLATKEGFFRFLTVYRLLMGNGTPTSGLYFMIASVDENGLELSTPIFKCLYNGVNLFSMDFTVPQVIIGDYFNKGGVLWSGLEQMLRIKGTGEFSGILDTVTIRTEPGDGVTTYPKGNITDENALIAAVIPIGNPNQTIKATGTVNGKQVSNIVYESMTKTVLNDYWNNYNDPWGYWMSRTLYSAYVYYCNVTVNCTDGTSYSYRKMLAGERVSRTTGNKGDYSYPIPTDPNYTLSQFINSTGIKYWFYSSYPVMTYLFPYQIDNLVLLDSTSERLFIDNLPHSAPQEKNRIWSDIDGIVRIT